MPDAASGQEVASNRAKAWSCAGFGAGSGTGARADPGQGQV